MQKNNEFRLAYVPTDGTNEHGTRVRRIYTITSAPKKLMFQQVLRTVIFETVEFLLLLCGFGIFYRNSAEISTV